MRGTRQREELQCKEAENRRLREELRKCKQEEAGQVSEST